MISWAMNFLQRSGRKFHTKKFAGFDVYNNKWGTNGERKEQKVVAAGVGLVGSPASGHEKGDNGRKSGGVWQAWIFHGIRCFLAL